MAKHTLHGDIRRLQFEQELAWMARKKGFLLRFALLWLAITVIGSATYGWLWNSKWGYFLAGLLLATGFFLVREAVLVGAKTFHTRHGVDAEDWTHTELRRFGIRRRVFRRLWFGNRDVDHVLVGPTSVLAVETKWRGNDLRVLPDGRLELPGHYLVDATSGARRVHANLSKRLNLPVIPVLMVWGPGLPASSVACSREGDVEVVMGPQAAHWRRMLVERWKHEQQTESSKAAAAELRAFLRRQAKCRGDRWWRRLRLVLGI